MIATIAIRRRCRSSDRCSTTVASSSVPRRRGASLRNILGGVRRRCPARVTQTRQVQRERPARRERRLGGRQRDLVVLRVAGDRVLELAHPLAELPTHLRQPLRTEDEEQDEQKDEKLPDSDSEGHGTDSSSERARRFAAFDGPGTMREDAACGFSAKSLRLSHTTARTETSGTARDQEPARRARGRNAHRQGCRSDGRHQREARDHGPERIGEVDARLRAHGAPVVRDHRGRDPPRRRRRRRARRRRARAEGPLPRLPVSRTRSRASP